MPQPNTQNATATAANFLTRCFSAARPSLSSYGVKSPAPQFRESSNWRPRSRLVTSPGSPTRTCWREIYVAANPLRSDSRKRTKECIVAVRHLIWI